MASSDSVTQLKFSGPAKYQLIIKGIIPDSYHSLFGGLEHRRERSKDGEVKSILEGELYDQAALAGILSTIYSLRLPLVGLKYIEPLK